jgi:CRP-like cAMP-binding protein
MDRRALLSRVPIFASLGEREMDALLAITATRRLGAKETLFRKGDPASQLYGVLSGRLKVMAAGKDGKELVFDVMAPGDVIGEIALMDPGPRSASVVALERSELLTLHRRELFPFLERHPKLALQLAGVLARRVRRLSTYAEDSVFLPLPARMAKTLLALAASYGEGAAAGAPGAPVDIPLAQQDLADMVGTTRESVNKQLRAWEAEGLVGLKRARVIVLDRGALEAISEVVVL